MLKIIAKTHGYSFRYAPAKPPPATLQTFAKREVRVRHGAFLFCKGKVVIYTTHFPAGTSRIRVAEDQTLPTRALHF